MTSDQSSILQKNYQAVLEFIDKMEQLGKLQDRVDITSSINPIWQLMLNEIRNLIDVDVCALFMVNEDSNEFDLQGVWPDHKEADCEEEVRLQIECGTFSWVINRRQPSLIPSFVFKDNKNNVMLPLGTNRKILGVILIVTPVKESLITRENLKLLAMLANQSSLMIENTILYEHLRKEHEALKKAQDQIILAEKMASIGRLTQGASHEILNPLNIIHGNIQLLLMDGRIDPEIKKYMNIIQQQSDRIARIVQGMSEFSRQEKRKIQIININHILEKVLSIIEYEKKYDNIKFNKAYDRNLPLIKGDPSEISQVILQVYSNASDAMPGGGTIKTITKLSKNSGLDLKNTPFIEISIQDTGCGILEKNIDKIFDPFYTTKETENKSGLGLAISYGIVKDHGGTILVESEEKKGTMISILLPVDN